MIEIQVRRWGVVATMAATLLLAVSCGEHRATAPETKASQDQNPGTNLLECPTNQTATNSALVGLLGWHIDPVTHDLLEEMGGVVDDKISRHITFTTGHLSGYAVAN